MDKLFLILVILGAINWGLIGLFQLDLVATLFGGNHTIVSRIVYTIIGLAGIYSIKFLFGEREHT